MSQDNNKLRDFSNTNNNEFINTPIPPTTSAEFYDINAALLNLVMKEQFFGSSNEDPTMHVNTFVELCDMQHEQEHVAQALEWMKLMIKNFPTHSLNLWIIIQNFYGGLNFVSRNLLDSATGGTYR